MAAIMVCIMAKIYRVILPVADIERAARFYGELLGERGVNGVSKWRRRAAEFGGAGL